MSSRAPLPEDTSDSSSSSFAEGEHHNGNAANYAKSELLTHRYRLWIHGANLPRQGRLRGRMPSTYAVVTRGGIAQAGPTDSGTVSRVSSFSPGIILGETEVVADNCHPQYTQSITLNYEYGTRFYFFVHIFLVTTEQQQRKNGTNTKRLPKALLGMARFEVGDIIGTVHHSRARRLRHGGCVFCRLEPRGESESFSFRRMSRGSLRALPVQQVHNQPAKEIIRYLRFRLMAQSLVLKRKNLRRVVGGALPDTIVTISKRPEKTNRNAWIEIYRSQPIYNTLDPKWDLSTVDLDCLCHGDVHQHIRISVMAVRPNRQPSLIGLCETNVRYLIEAAKLRTSGQQPNKNSRNAANVSGLDEGSEFILQRNSSKHRVVGRLSVLEADIVTMDEKSGAFRQVVFPEHDQRDGYDGVPDLAYPGGHDARIDLTALLTPEPQLVQNGCKLNFCVAIDFTSSNGDPRNDEASLHYQSESLNDYEETILAVGQAMDQSHCVDRSCSVWGFGAKFGDGIVRHLFRCGSVPQVYGTDGILEAYRSMFSSPFTMSGPTVFLNVIQAAAKQAKAQHDGMTRHNLCYTILLIITDGYMDDFDETARKINVYNFLPLSIIFVGVGRSDFSRLDQLHQSCPKNTTFVEFRSQESPSRFALAALQNLPRQIAEYVAERCF